MTPEQDDLIRRYGLALEAVTSAQNHAQVYPVSMLPASKVAIGAAIRAALAQDVEPEVRRVLENGFVLLASFVPDYDWIVCSRVHAALFSGDLAAAQAIAPEDSDHWQATMRRSQEEMKELLGNLHEE